MCEGREGERRNRFDGGLKLARRSYTTIRPPIINESLAGDDHSSDTPNRARGHKGKATGQSVCVSPGTFDTPIKQIIGNPGQREHETTTPQMNSPV